MDIALNYLFSYQAFLLILVVVLLKTSIKFVPQNRAYIISRFGKYNTTLEAGLNFIFPFIDTVAADRSLKEQAEDVPEQSAITKDNITLSVDGVLYFRVVDPYKATYGVENYTFAVKQLAQTTMRSELGKMELDKTFEERDLLNTNIVSALNDAAAPWGVQVLRYELKDINPPNSVLDAMEQQMKAERLKRAQILESEGDRQAAINRAEGEKQSIVLAAQAEKEEQILKAQGEAEAIIQVAKADAEAIETLGKAAATEDGQKAVQLDLAKSAIKAKEQIAKESSLILLPDGSTEIGNVVAQAMAIANKIGQKVD
jgi:regulator of protease activity HflC (stomatin/prohibitin superfamily)